MAKSRKQNNGGGIGRVSGLADGSGQTAKHNLFIIDDETLTDPSIKDLVFVPIIDGQPKSHGLVPRKHSIYPPEMFAPPTEMVLIDPSEYSERIKERKRTKSTLHHLCDWSSKDQNGDGYCWGYSVTGAVEFLRRIMNQPFLRLSAHAICAIIKRGRNEGGWCGLAAKFAREVGIPSDEFWKTHSRDLSQDTPALRANAALHKVTEDWVDLTRSIYDQNLTERQVDSCSLTNVPMAWDFNWWSHSVFGCGLEEIEGGSFGREMRNSWTDSWGDKGWSLLRGSKAIPDGAVALRVTGASVA